MSEMGTGFSKYDKRVWVWYHETSILRLVFPKEFVPPWDFSTTPRSVTTTKRLYGCLRWSNFFAPEFASAKIRQCCVGAKKKQPSRLSPPRRSIDSLRSLGCKLHQVTSWESQKVAFTAPSADPSAVKLTVFGASAQTITFDCYLLQGVYLCRGVLLAART
jgi:hypothetical protein